jgi:hypothetical protein
MYRVDEYGDEGVVQPRDDEHHNVDHAPQAVAYTDLPADDIPIPTPQSSVLGGAAAGPMQRPLMIRHGRRAGAGQLRHHESGWLFFNPNSYELVKPSHIARETPTAELELRVLQQRAAASGDQSLPSAVAVPAPPSVALPPSLTPSRFRFMAPVERGGKDQGIRPSPRMHIKAKKVEVTDALRMTAAVATQHQQQPLHIPHTATTPTKMASCRGDAESDEHQKLVGWKLGETGEESHLVSSSAAHDLKVSDVGEILKQELRRVGSNNYVPRVGSNNFTSRAATNMGPSPGPADCVPQPPPPALSGFAPPPEAVASIQQDESKDGVNTVSERNGADTVLLEKSAGRSKRSLSTVDLDELVSALQIDFGGDLRDHDGPTQFDLLQMIAMNCIRGVLRDIPFTEGEFLPEEEDINVMVNLQRQYSLLHPPGNMCIAESVPNELFGAVTKTSAGVPVELEHEGLVTGARGHVGPMRGLQGIHTRYATSAHIFSTPKDIHSRQQLLTELRAQQRKAEEYFGIYSTYTRIPPPLVDDMMTLELDLKFDPALLLTTQAQIVAPAVLTSARNTAGTA